MNKEGFGGKGADFAEMKTWFPTGSPNLCWGEARANLKRRVSCDSLSTFCSFDRVVRIKAVGSFGHI